MILYDWNKFVSHMKSLVIIFTSQIIIYRAMTISMWQIKKLINNFFQMEDDKKC